MIDINGVKFVPLKNVRYRHDYVDIVKRIEAGNLNKLEAFRKLILTDLWFIVYFIMGIQDANHPFVIQRCKDVQDGPKTNTLDIWARGHYKSSCITVAETAQYHLNNPDHCTCIFSYKKPAAEKFLDSIRSIYMNPLAIACFPDLLYKNAFSESPSWSLQNGITINRTNKTRGEATVEASGLVEGMLTGSHFERRIYDDVETPDMAESPDEMDKCFSRFEMSKNLGTGRDTDVERVIGTYYNHNGPLVRIRNTSLPGGSKKYHLRLIPVTDNGLSNGRPVLVSDAKHEELKGQLHYFSQQLCDPTPRGEQKLNAEYLNEIESQFVPRNIIKFLLVDPAGDASTNTVRKSDAWSIMLLGIEPGTDETGAWKRYILDAFIDKLDESEAVEIITNMYISGGVISKLGYEKFSNFTPAVAMHVLEALKKRGRYVNEKNKSFVWLRPASRNKNTFIANSLMWPLNNSKWFISKNVPVPFRERLKMEMQQFPYWHDDGLNTMAYLDDIIKDETFRYNLNTNKPRALRPAQMPV